MSGLNDLAELHDELQSLQGTALTDLTMLEMNGCINSTADVAKKNSALTHLDRMTTALDAAFGDLADASSEMLLAMMDLMFGDRNKNRECGRIGYPCWGRIDGRR